MFVGLDGVSFFKRIIHKIFLWIILLKKNVKLQMTPLFDYLQKMKESDFFKEYNIKEFYIFKCNVLLFLF
jgi:hypothetical protein